MLSLPAGKPRDLLVTVTYVIVLFSLLVRGLTVGRLASIIPIALIMKERGEPNLLKSA